MDKAKLSHMPKSQTNTKKLLYKKRTLKQYNKKFKSSFHVDFYFKFIKNSLSSIVSITSLSSLNNQPRPR